MVAQRPNLSGVSIGGIRGEDLPKLFYYSKSEKPGRWKRAWANLGVAGHRCRYFFKGRIITDKKLINRFIVHFRSKTEGLDELQPGDAIPANLRGYPKKINDLLKSIRDRANGSQKYAALFADYQAAKQDYRNAKNFIRVMDQMEDASLNHDLTGQDNDEGLGSPINFEDAEETPDLHKLALEESQTVGLDADEKPSPAEDIALKIQGEEKFEELPKDTSDNDYVNPEDAEEDAEVGRLALQDSQIEDLAADDNPNAQSEEESESPKDADPVETLSSQDSLSISSSSTEDKFSRKLTRIIDKCLTRHQGFIVGEKHTDRLSKKFLIDHMGQLQRLGVKYLFLESVTEEEYDDGLGKFLASEEDDMSKSLEFKLLKSDVYNIARHEFVLGQEDALNMCRDYEKDQKYNNYQLYREAKRHGIQVVAIDKSSLMKNKLKPQNKRRLPEMNQFAEDKIKGMVKDDEKYVVFCGAAHTLHVKKSEPGLGPRLGVPVIHIHSPNIRDREGTIKKKHSYKGQFNYTPDYYVRYGINP